MRKISFILILSLLLCGCAPAAENAQVAATTLPVYTFSLRLLEGTGIRVTRLVTESVSCLHDYTLQTGQMRAIEGAQVLVISGAGLEEFLEDALSSADTVIDASLGIELHCGDHAQEHGHDHDGHRHENDPHIWLSPANAAVMAQNICAGLSQQFPEHAATIQANLSALQADILALQNYGEQQLSSLFCRELITFHDGFGYLADAFDLTILRAVEEESGSEAAVAELIELIGIVKEHRLNAIFTETNGSASAAAIIAAETGIQIYTLDMAMAGDDYFAAMYRNIDTLKEALG